MSNRDKEPDAAMSAKEAERMGPEDLVTRLRKRAEIRRQIPGRKSVQNGEPDRISDLLEEAASRVAAAEELIGKLERRLKMIEENPTGDSTGNLNLSNNWTRWAKRYAGDALAELEAWRKR